MNDFQMGDKGLINGSKNEIIKVEVVEKKKMQDKLCGILEKTGKNVGEQQKTKEEE
jgi:hypothetical protein